MKGFTRLAAVAALAGALAVPAATPATAASGFSFGFGVPGFSYGVQQDDNWRWRHRRAAPRAGISIDIGPLHLSAGHVTRCETRFRSYQRHTDSYMGFDGRRHRCRL